jgi:hypothetical protein
VSDPSNEERDGRSIRARSTPLWVKVLGIIALVMLVLFIVSRLAGVEHGPGIHSFTPPAMQLHVNPGA